MGEIPEHIRSEARKAIYDTGRGMIGRERNYLEYRVSRALLAAEKRGREEAAKIAEGKSAEFNFEKALADCRDDDYGYHSGRLAAAAAIRSGQ